MATEMVQKAFEDFRSLSKTNQKMLEAMFFNMKISNPSLIWEDFLIEESAKSFFVANLTPKKPRVKNGSPTDAFLKWFDAMSLANSDEKLAAMVSGQNRMIFDLKTDFDLTDIDCGEKLREYLIVGLRTISDVRRMGTFNIWHGILFCFVFFFLLFFSLIFFIHSGMHLVRFKSSSQMFRGGLH